MPSKKVPARAATDPTEDGPLLETVRWADGTESQLFLMNGQAGGVDCVHCGRTPAVAVAVGHVGEGSVVACDPTCQAALVAEVADIERRLVAMRGRLSGVPTASVPTDFIEELENLEARIPAARAASVVR
jgi:hypothetical protein